MFMCFGYESGYQTSRVTPSGVYETNLSTFTIHMVSCIYNIYLLYAG